MAAAIGKSRTTARMGVPASAVVRINPIAEPQRGRRSQNQACSPAKPDCSEEIARRGCCNWEKPDYSADGSAGDAVVRINPIAGPQRGRRSQNQACLQSGETGLQRGNCAAWLLQLGKAGLQRGWEC
ncbi:hypothetical protein, partial [Paenibacillus aestuarii]|uniref:hypothetical protein n=1 Tax=Paenibacillus aestuarii TaxID=516965 RepID=UPI0022E9D3EE